MKISVVIPALNEEATVAHVVHTVAQGNPHEIIVVDADSTDNTATAAASAGATVKNWRDILPTIEPKTGKGESLWRGVYAASGDVVVFIDADLESITPTTVDTLAAPLKDPHVHLVKATYQRTYNGKTTGGGRVTELTAKPLIRQLFPTLTDIEQPLAGEYAIRRTTALNLPFVEGYGVEIGLLIDCYRQHGGLALTQVDIPRRVHRNRPLDELGPMADIVAATILDRAGVGPAVGQRPPLATINH